MSDNSSELLDDGSKLKAKKEKKKARVEEVEEEVIVKKNDPNAVTNFRISEPLRKKLQEKGIESLFPIQAMTFNTILDGSDLVGRARTGQADFDLCTDCFNNRRFGSGMSPLDFILMEPAEVAGVSGGKWTDQETLLLLEALELYKENWNEIAEHVGTKSKAQCILHFVQMPVEDAFVDCDDDVHTDSKETADPTVTNNNLSIDKDASEIIDNDTSNTVLKARELIRSRIDPLQLVSQLANLIMDILVRKCENGGSEVRSKFSSRYTSEVDLQKLSYALKILSETEKQLRVSKIQTTWFIAALLQLSSIGYPSTDADGTELCLRGACNGGALQEELGGSC